MGEGADPMKTYGCGEGTQNLLSIFTWVIPNVFFLKKRGSDMVPEGVV